MRVKSIAESTFIEQPFVIKIFVLSIFEWPIYTGLLYYITKDRDLTQNHTNNESNSKHWIFVLFFWFDSLRPINNLSVI